MIITRLHLKRFGRHENLLLQYNAPVVGLVGPNSSGKSTVLAALKFAITGETDDNLDSYVYNYEGNGSVEMDFVKNGKKGTIFRQIGKTSKRWLKYDNAEKPITAAKEVDARMSEIFGADKKAIANAVFVTQGELENLLFTEGVEKRSTFIKIVNLSFCAKNAKILEGKIKRLSDTVVDLTAARDAALEQRRIATQNWDARKAELAECVNWEPEIAFLATQERLQNEISFVESEIGRMRNNLTLHQSQLQPILIQSGFSDAAALRHNLANTEQQLATATQQLNYLKSVAAELVHLDRVDNEINASMARIKELAEELKTRNPETYTLADLHLLLNKNEGYLNAIDRRVTLDTEINRKKTDLANAAKFLNDLVVPGTARETILTYDADILQANLKINSYQRTLALDRELKTCFAGLNLDEPQICQKCGMKVHGNRPLPDHEINGILELISEETALRDSTTQKRQTLIDEWTNYEREFAKRNSTVCLYHKQLDELQSEYNKILVPSEIRENVVSIIDRIRNDLIPLLTHNPRQMEREKTTLKNKMDERQNYKLAIANKGNREAFAQDVIVAQEQYQKQLSEQRTKLFNFETEVTRLENEINRLNGEVDSQTKRVEALHQQLNEQAASDRLVQFAIGLNNNWEMVKAELNARNQSRLGLVGQVKEAENAYTSANKQYHDIEDRMAKDAEKRKIIDDLVKARDHLVDDGIPMAYVNYQFKRLTTLTQEALSKINANFRIEIDSDEALSFRFLRLDMSDNVMHSMRKLSGGQRVRLAVAFLMAVQRRLVKDIGLLILDEITVHLDQEGIEQIADFLRSMNKDLANTEMQIFVVDHNPIVKTALGSCVELSNKESKTE